MKKGTKASSGHSGEKHGEEVTQTTREREKEKKRTEDEATFRKYNFGTQLPCNKLYSTPTAVR